MYCENCGKRASGNEKFCTSCGKPLSISVKKETPKDLPKQAPVTYKPARVKRGPTIPAIIGIVVIIGFVVYGIWASDSESKNDTAVQTSNTALTTVFSSDTNDATEQAIQQFKMALASATDDPTKLTILTNLAVTYNSNGDTANAISTFQQALGYAPAGSSDYYYISGEMAELQNQPSNAQSDFLEANQLLPNDPQISTALALFYLDLNSSWTSYDDNAKALQYAKIAYNAETNDLTTQNLAVTYYYNENYKETISLLLPLNLNAHPDSALYLGYAYAHEKDVKDAEFYFQKAIDLGVQVPQEVNDYMNSN